MGTANKTQSLKLRVSVSRDFGTERVTFEMEGEFDISSTQQRQIAMDRMYTAIDDQFTHYAQNRLPDTTHNPGIYAGNRRKDHGITHEPMDITHWLREIKGGKEYFKVKSPKWTKYGVRVWEENVPSEIAEHMRKHNLFEYANTDYTCTIGLDGDKPTKVLSVERLL